MKHPMRIRTCIYLFEENHAHRGDYSSERRGKYDRPKQRKYLCVDVVLYHVQDAGEFFRVDSTILVHVEGVHVHLGLVLSPFPLFSQLSSTDEPISVVIEVGHDCPGSVICDPVGR